MTPDNPSPDRELQAALRAHLDDAALTPAELRADLERVLPARRRRGLSLGSALPGAFALVAAALFFAVRSPPPADDDGAMHIYIADAGDPQGALVLDLTLPKEKP